MKLYTEEQVRKAIDMARDRDMEYTKYGIFDELTPIEIPDDDEDAGTITLYISSVRDEKEAVFFVAGAMKYNEYIRYKILNQNKLIIKTDGKVGLSNPDETTNNKLNINQNK